MIKLFAVLNGEILEDLGDNVSATYTRIHYLLNGLKDLSDIEVHSIKFKQISDKNLFSIIYNNVMKSIVAVQTAAELIEEKPIVYFAYPHSLTTVQNRWIFRLCQSLKLKTVLDIQDTIEQADVIGTGRSTLDMNLEGYCIRKARLILALNRPMWKYLEDKYQIPPNKLVVLVPNAYDESFCKVYSTAYKSIENRFNICYLGGLTKNRGIDILVEACEELYKNYPYLRLYLFGFFGEGISIELKNRISKSSFIIKRQVPRKDLPGALQDVDLFVMPYDPKESYMNFSSPTKFFEYIGTGKPILCTRCESLLQIGKERGIIYVDYDAEDIEKNARILIENPQIREKISLELIKLRPYHTWNERAKRFRKALEIL